MLIWIKKCLLHTLLHIYIYQIHGVATGFSLKKKLFSTSQI